MLNRFFIFGLFLGIFFEAGQARNHDHYRFHQEREEFVCPEPDGAFPVSPGVCFVDYYLCLAGTPYPQRCAGVDQVFDPSIGRCVSSGECNGSAPSSTASTTSMDTTTTTTSGPTDVTDTTLSSTTTTKITTTGGPTTFECPTDDGFYPIPNYCGPNYFACVNGSPYVKTCPGDSYFDPITEVCTSQDLVTCLNPFQCPGDGFFAIPGVCSQKYYVCVAGTVTVSECPPGTLFEPDTLRCAPEASASCKQPPTTTSSTTTTSTTSTPSTTTTPGTTTPPAEFVCPGVGQYPYPDDCTKYYLCWTGGSLVASCPAGQVFNPETTFCDDPANVPGACGTSKYSDIFLRSTSLSCLDARGSANKYLVIQDSKRCDQYYTCHKGESTYSHWRCRDNQLFDSTFKGCNFPEYVNCGTRSLP